MPVGKKLLFHLFNIIALFVSVNLPVFFAGFYYNDLPKYLNSAFFIIILPVILSGSLFLLSDKLRNITGLTNTYHRILVLPGVTLWLAIIVLVYYFQNDFAELRYGSRKTDLAALEDSGGYGHLEISGTRAETEKSSVLHYMTTHKRGDTYIKVSNYYITVPVDSPVKPANQAVVLCEKLTTYDQASSLKQLTAHWEEYKKRLTSIQGYVIRDHWDLQRCRESLEKRTGTVNRKVIYLQLSQPRGTAGLIRYVPAVNLVWFLLPLIYMVRRIIIR